MINRVTHITLFVLDQDEALKFYQKLGFKLHTDVMSADGFRWLTIAAPGDEHFEIALTPATTEDERDLVGNQAGDVPFMCISTDDVDKTYQEWRRHSVEVIHEPQDMPWGRQALFADLYGNVINLTQIKK